jgi:hypothetical protein
MNTEQGFTLILDNDEPVHSLHIFVFCCFSFDGKIVAKLPFVPISFLQGISHRNLPGTDYTDCSFIFLYILCTMAIRQVYITCIRILHAYYFS